MPGSFKPPRGANQETNELAQGLRKILKQHHLGVRDLEDEAALKRSAISERLSGQRYPEWHFIEAVIRTCAKKDQRAAERMRAYLRPLWEAADPARHLRTALGQGRGGGPPADPVPPVEPGQAASPGKRNPRRVRTFALIGAAVVILAAAVAIWAYPRSPSLPVPGDNICYNPKTIDVTYPDGSTVLEGTTFTKTWLVQNCGTATWSGRYLTRQDPASGPDTCSSAKRVPVSPGEPVFPGHTVTISVTFTAPVHLAHCYSMWKMTTADGAFYFPNLPQGVYIDVQVVAPPKG